MKRKIIIIFLIIGIFSIVFLVFINNKFSLQTSDISQLNLELNYNTELITNINNIKINNKDIKNNYKFIFIADLHASIIDNYEQNEQVRNSLIERNNLFTVENKNHISSDKIFPEIINYTNNIKADALLLGGDIIDSPSNSNFRFLRENLNNLKVDYLYTLGNHDWTYAWNYQSQETEQSYYPKFLEFMDDTNISYIEYDDLIILAINNSKMKIEDESVEKVQEVLNKNKPTIVMFHVPISTEKIINNEKDIRNRVTTIRNDGANINSSTQEVIDMIFSEKYNVFYVISGHLHFEINDKLNERIYEEVVAPAYNGEIDLIEIN